MEPTSTAAQVEDLLIRFGALARELAPPLPAPAAAPLLQELSRLLEELTAVDATSHRYTLLRDLRVRMQRVEMCKALKRRIKSGHLTAAMPPEIISKTLFFTVSLP